MNGWGFSFAADVPAAESRVATCLLALRPMGKTSIKIVGSHHAYAICYPWKLRLKAAAWLQAT